MVPLAIETYRQPIGPWVMGWSRCQNPAKSRVQELNLSTANYEFAAFPLGQPWLFEQRICARKIVA